MSELMRLSEQSVIIPIPSTQEAQLIIEKSQGQLGDYNFVVLGKEAGAGHLRQASRLTDFLKDLGADPQEVLFQESEGRIQEFYTWLQRKPGLCNLAYSLMGFLDDRVIDFFNRQQAEKDKKEIERLSIARTDRPTVFLGTYVQATASAGLAMREKDILVEYVPDPWQGKELRAMTIDPAIVPAGALHVVVLHDQNTANEYTAMRPELPKGARRLILPWGTISAPEFLFKERNYGKTLDRLKHPSPAHPLDIFFELSGSYIPQVDTKIQEFILSYKEKIRRGEARVVVYPMHHRQSYESLRKTLVEASLTNCSNIVIAPAAQNIYQAVLIRESLLTGKKSDLVLPQSFDSAIVLSKSGEGPLEERPIPTGVFYVSAPHENGDLQVGVEEGKAVDLTMTNPDQWLKKTKQDLELIIERGINTPSYALLSPLQAILGR